MFARTAVASLAVAGAFVVTDKVYVNNQLVAEGDSVEDNVGCHPHEGSTTFKVCGANVKVVAHLMSNCRDYSKYSETIGSCDAALGTDHCDEKTLTSGYTNHFEWKAYSYDIQPCK
mmetsp:Transcript_93101/g.249258  ORF Transcript_93101/g.249258 Transcript_93101/m.249258 type:complete len:116 (-) Transcript_93101:171-518(-)